MEFTIVYEGPLLSNRDSPKKAEHKHSVRKQFHPQLRKLWEIKLSQWMNSTQASRMRFKLTAGDPIVEQTARAFSVCNYRFVPLVTEKLMISCKLDILFLRKESVQGRIVQGGDIDNRLKTLFDALKAPRTCSEIGGAAVGADEDPFFCLLEDDCLITEVRVRTDTLLIPDVGNQTEHDVKLIIGVTLRPQQMTESNADFA